MQCAGARRHRRLSPTSSATSSSRRTYLAKSASTSRFCPSGCGARCQRSRTRCAAGSVRGARAARRENSPRRAPTPTWPQTVAPIMLRWMQQHQQGRGFHDTPAPATMSASGAPLARPQAGAAQAGALPAAPQAFTPGAMASMPPPAHTPMQAHTPMSRMQQQVAATPSPYTNMMATPASQASGKRATPSPASFTPDHHARFKRARTGVCVCVRDFAWCYCLSNAHARTGSPASHCARCCCRGVHAAVVEGVHVSRHSPRRLPARICVAVPVRCHIRAHSCVPRACRPRSCLSCQ